MLASLANSTAASLPDLNLGWPLMSHASPKGEDLTSRERSTDKCQGHAVGDGEFSIAVPTGYCSKFDNFGVSAFEKDVTTSEDYSLLDGEAEGRRDFIRLQAHPDANLYYCLQSKASTFEVLQKMRQVTEKMGAYCTSDLYERPWLETSTFGGFGASGSSKKEISTSSTLHVLQFNTLAEGLSSAADNPLPFAKSRENKAVNMGYGGFTEVPNPEIVFDFSLRRWRILEVIVGSCYKESPDKISGATTCNFDLIAMEEVDRFAGFFQPVLAVFGYRGIFAAKRHAPGIDLGYYSDGCAIFWKDDAFELLGQRRGSYKVATQVYIIATLRHKETGRIIIAAATHLKASASEVNEKIRTEQAKELGNILQTMSSDSALDVDASFRENGSVPIFLLGDFNSEANGEGQTTVRSIIERNEKPHFQSAYPLDHPYSTWKTRGKVKTKRVIDYIFHNSQDIRGVHCTHILGLPEEEEMEPHRLPGFRYPSDHLAIAARFRISCSERKRK